MELYLDPIATTSRAVLALCEQESIAINVHRIQLMRGEHHQPPLAELNPNRLVPVLVDQDFVLTESGAMLHYLARHCGSALLPQGNAAQARVHERMAWFETNLYRDFGYQFVYPQLLPQHRRPDDAVNAATIAWGRQQSRRWFDVLDRHILGAQGRWLCGDALTIADLQGAAIASLGDLVGYDYTPWPNLQRWLASVRELPAWQRANVDFDAFVASMTDRPAAGSTEAACAQAA